MLTAIDKEKPIPLYYQIETSIRGQIEAGGLSPGDKLPTEQWYCDFFGVSRMTVRKALQELEGGGLISRSRGQGPVVAQPRVSRKLGRLSGLSSAMAAQGRKVASLVLGLGPEPADPVVSRQLELPDGTGVLAVRRLRLSDGEPLALQDAFLPGGLCGPLEAGELEEGSLYAALERRGVQIDSAVQRVTARMPTDAQCRLLGIRQDAPLVYSERTAYLERGAPAEFSRSWYIAAKFDMTIELHR